MNKLTYAELDSYAEKAGYAKDERHGHRPRKLPDGWQIRCTCGYFNEKLYTSREHVRTGFYYHVKEAKP